MLTNRINKQIRLVIAVTVTVTTISPAWAGNLPESVPSPARLWQSIRTIVAEGRLLPGSTAYQPGSRMVDYYTTDKVDEIAHGTITAAGGVVRVTRYPAGSLLIKENFNIRKKLVGVTAMLKLPHYDGADRNWVMAAYSPQGKPLAFGKVGSCIQCHMVAQKQDFVFAPPPTNLLPAAFIASFFPGQKISPVYLRLLQELPGSVL